MGPIGYWNNSSDSDNYTKCSSMCDTCDNGTTCTACATNYKKKVDDTASNHKCFDSSNEPQKYFYSAKKLYKNVMKVALHVQMRRLQNVNHVPINIKRNQT